MNEIKGIAKAGFLFASALVATTVAPFALAAAVGSFMHLGLGYDSPAVVLTGAAIGYVVGVVPPVRSIVRSLKL